MQSIYQSFAARFFFIGAALSLPFFAIAQGADFPDEEGFETVSVELKINGSNGPLTVERGSRIVLTWSSEDADSCRGNWTRRTLNPSGRQAGKVTKSRNFTITCTGSDGERARDTVAVTIIGQRKVDQPKPPELTKQEAELRATQDPRTAPAPRVTVTDTVKCVFKDSTQKQECYSANAANDGGHCSGIETCGTQVTGTKGIGITWKSSCGGYAYTTMGEGNQYATFSCTSTAPATQTSGNVGTASIRLTVSCAPTTVSAKTGEPVVWNATARGGSGLYRYEWVPYNAYSGSPTLTGATLRIVYTTAEMKDTAVKVTSGSESVTELCTPSVKVEAAPVAPQPTTDNPPPTTEPAPALTPAPQAKLSVGTLSALGTPAPQTGALYEGAVTLSGRITNSGDASSAVITPVFEHSPYGVEFSAWKSANAFSLGAGESHSVSTPWTAQAGTNYFRLCAGSVCSAPVKVETVSRTAPSPAPAQQTTQTTQTAQTVQTTQTPPASSPPPAPLPSVDFAIDGVKGSYAVSSGTFITPSWSSTNASHCATNWNSDRSTVNPGLTVGPVTADKTYTVTCYNSTGESASASVAVTVTTPAAPPAQPAAAPIFSVGTPIVTGTPTGVTGQLYAGQMTITAKVTNFGGSYSGAIQPKFQLSTNSFNWFEWTPGSTITDLASNQSKDTSYSWGGGTGVWYFRACLEGSCFSEVKVDIIAQTSQSDWFARQLGAVVEAFSSLFVPF